MLHNGIQGTYNLLINNRPLLFHVCDVFTVPERITQRPSHSVVKIGDRVQLNCSVQGYSDVMEWKYSGGDLSEKTIYTSQNETTMEPLFEIQHPGDGEYNLVIDEVDRDMAGLYQCSFPAVSLNVPAQLVTLCKYY